MASETSTAELARRARRQRDLAARDTGDREYGFARGGGGSAPAKIRAKATAWEQMQRPGPVLLQRFWYSWTECEELLDADGLPALTSLVDGRTGVLSAYNSEEITNLHEGDGVQGVGVDESRAGFPQDVHLQPIGGGWDGIATSGVCANEAEIELEPTGMTRTVDIGGTPTEVPVYRFSKVNSYDGDC